MRQGNAAPGMAGGAGLHRHDTRRLIRKQLHQPHTRYRPVEDNGAIGPDGSRRGLWTRGPAPAQSGRSAVRIFYLEPAIGACRGVLSGKVCDAGQRDAIGDY